MNHPERAAGRNTAIRRGQRKRQHPHREFVGDLFLREGDVRTRLREDAYGSGGKGRPRLGRAQVRHAGTGELLQLFERPQPLGSVEGDGAFILA